MGLLGTARDAKVRRVIHVASTSAYSDMASNPPISWKAPSEASCHGPSAACRVQ
jgi:nucleoside-diphosphate-sugar epimerase